MIADGRCGDAFAIVHQALTKQPDCDLFALWNDCATTLADANAIIQAARELYLIRQKDSWSACCLALALGDIGRVKEAEILIGSLNIENDVRDFHILWTRYWLNHSDALLDRLLVVRADDPLLLTAKSVSKANILLTEGKLDKDGRGQELVECFKPPLERNPYCLAALFWRSFYLTQAYIAQIVQCLNDNLVGEDLERMERICKEHYFTISTRAFCLIIAQRYKDAIMLFDSVLSDSRVQWNEEMSDYFIYLRAQCQNELNCFD